jgi:site-specific recombinase XerD
MRVRRQLRADGGWATELIGPDGEPVEVVVAFLDHLSARDCSPNTVRAYAYDLLRFWRFLVGRGLEWSQFTAREALELLAYLRSRPVSGPRGKDSATAGLAATSVNRALAAVSSFYEFAILSGWGGANPIERRPDPALARVAARHRPAMGSSSRQQPVRRSVRVKTVQRVPRPLEPDPVAALVAAARSLRDRALLLLMLEGGLRPGEVLGLRLDDIAYGRRRVTIRHRADHPAGARAKSRTERVVDLHEGAALAAVSAYVMSERPADIGTVWVFVIRSGPRRGLALSYDGLVRMFTRCAQRAGIKQSWVTPHTLRHTHATRMWEAGMRELTLQRRLGHASAESTRRYTRVSDPLVVAEYRAALDRSRGAGA